MTKQTQCYENAMAEWLNEIVKDEFYLVQTFMHTVHAKRAAKNTINVYNQIRLHVSLVFKTPNMLFKL